MKNWITFVGEGRSGHTIMSAILGSHPHIRMSEEQKYISKWCRGYTKDAILDALHDSGEGKYRKTMGFDRIDIETYKNPLLSLGDKCGWDAVNEVRKRGEAPDLLDRFSKAMEMPVKVIHTTRHPLDNIAAWIGSSKYQRLFPDEDRRHNKMIRRYSQFYESAEQVMEGQDVFHLRNEKLIADPVGTLSDLTSWLGVPAKEEWLSYCAERVFAKPHQRRDDFVWIEKYRKQVLEDRVIKRFPSLKYYLDLD